MNDILLNLTSPNFLMTGRGLGVGHLVIGNEGSGNGRDVLLSTLSPLFRERIWHKSQQPKQHSLFDL
jgi:hypothetical protein